MSTSANVIFYDVYNKRHQYLKTHRQNMLCKDHVTEELEHYQPPEEFTVVGRWPDEDEKDHFSEPKNLALFLADKKLEWKDE